MLLIVISSTIICVCANAQWQTFRTTTTVPTPQGPVKIPSSYSVYTPMYYGNGDPYKNIWLLVTFTNDSIIRIKGSITGKGDRSVIKIKKGSTIKEILPEQTKQILFVNKFNNADSVIGLPQQRKYWIASHNKNETIKTYTPMLWGANLFYVTDKNGNIAEATKDIVLDLVSGNEKAVQHANKGNLEKAIAVYNESMRKKDKKEKINGNASN
ncbi:hypothetical protein [Niabella hibiscisoli]|uniref:hypothetical protein n=1 Tax=Niabella hibiscisoli TaxID=1825928 RepID=UPI001F0DF769|nr:hypothetical protein [Niabella hibiscisoli]MCH5717040.1 hypothetical protein [Niabella hibiscisoli]